MTKRLTIVIVLQPLESHLRALLTAIHAAASLGHTVIICAPTKLARAIIDTYRLTSLPHVTYQAAGEDFMAPRRTGNHLASTLANSGNDEFCRVLAVDYLAGPQVTSMAESLGQIVKRSNADLILRDITDFGSSIVAESRAIPCLTFDNGWSPLFLTDLRSPLQKALAPHRVALGLPEEPAAPPLPIFTPAPKALFHPDITTPEIRPYRHSTPKRHGEQLPAWFNRIPPELHLICVSLGSILTAAPAFRPILRDHYQRIIAALAAIPCTAVVAAGRDLAHELTAPRNVRVVPFLPLPLFLEAHPAALITHCGFSTLREAFDALVQMIFYPISSDQIRNAARCAQLGLGPLIPTAAQPDQIAQAITSTLNNERYALETLRWHRMGLALPPLESQLDHAIREYC